MNCIHGNKEQMMVARGKRVGGMGENGEGEYSHNYSLLFLKSPFDMHSEKF